MRLDHLRIHHIRMIVMVADGIPVHKVAKAMNVTSPAVSIAINRCEEMLGAPIFVRELRRMVGITPEGVSLITRFRAIVAMLDADAETVWQTAQLAQSQWLKVGLDVIPQRVAA